MELDEDDWTRLERLRGTYLAGRGRSPWHDARDLELYDATFGRRIAWKWRSVLDELCAREAPLPRGRVLDWGCGTGVAAEAWIERMGRASVDELCLFDAVALAQGYAVERLRKLHADLPIIPGLGSAPPDVLLVSHVISELSPEELETLMALASGARWIVWVEPGSTETSRALGAVRGQLLDAFDVVAPCTHAGACPMLSEGLSEGSAGGTATGRARAREREWCHFFARPAPEVFTSAHWAHVGQRLKIDLRSLPYSFLVFQRKGDAAANEVVVPAVGASSAGGIGLDRIVGRPRVEKGRVLVDACGADGLRMLRMLERDDREFFERCEDAAGESLLYRLEVTDGRIRRATRAT